MRSGGLGVVGLLLACVLTACAGGSGASADAAPDAAVAGDGRADGTAADAPAADAEDAGDTPAAPDAAPDVAPDAAPDVAPPWPPFDPAVCGAPPYTWLPPAATGGVVTWEPAPVFAALTAAQVNALLVAAGEDDLTVPYGVRNFRLRYVTQDRGALREATALVGVPDGLPAGTQPPAVLYLHGATGAMDDCAPSRDAADGALPTTLLASLGYLTVAPDYLGMLGFGAPSPAGTIHPYLVAEATAIASWDALRAALAATGADPALAAADRARVLLLGGSQGGHAAFVVERYAPHYAPEFGLLGAVALAPPTDLVGLATWATPLAGLPTRSLVGAFGAMHDWYGATASLAAVLTDAEPHHLAAAVPEWMATSCDGLRAMDALPVEQVWAADFLAAAREGRWDDLAPWGCYLAENSPARMTAPRASDTPFLMVMGEEDELVSAAVERADVAALCAAGYEIEYIECAGGGHSIGAVEMVFYALGWMEDRLAGAPLAPERTCVVAAPVACDGL